MVFARDVDRHGIRVATCVFIGFVNGQLVGGVQTARGDKPRNS